MRSILLALSKPIATRLVEPVVAKAKLELRRLVIALCLAATGIACIIAGLAYVASSLWHALVPAIGTVGADVTLGVFYTLLAFTLLLISSRMLR